MKLSQLISEDYWLGRRFSKSGPQDIVKHDNMYFIDDTSNRDRKSNPKSKSRSESRSESPVGGIPITKTDIIKNYIHYHPNLKRDGKILAGTAAVGGAAVVGKKLWDKHHAAKNAPKNAPLTHSDRAKAFMTNHGKKVAAGTLAALGAGVGVKALLKYLRKKKQS